MLDKTPKEKTSLPHALPWMSFEIGDRVVIRRKETDGFYDALGILLEKTPHYVVIETRKGKITVPASKMVRGKKVPPPPNL